jgi:hypothetical protein
MPNVAMPTQSDKGWEALQRIVQRREEGFCRRQDPGGMLKSADNRPEALERQSLLLQDASHFANKVVGSAWGQLDGTGDTIQPVPENFLGCVPARVPLGQLLLGYWVFGVRGPSGNRCGEHAMDGVEGGASRPLEERSRRIFDCR